MRKALYIQQLLTHVLRVLRPDLTYNPLIDTVYGKNLSWYSALAINPPTTVISGTVVLCWFTQ